MIKLIERIKATWLRLFGVDRKLENDVRKVIKVVAAIKKGINHPGVDVLTAFIPGDVDDKIVQAVRKALDKVLGIANAFGVITESMPVNPLMQHAVLHKTASLAVMDMYNLKESDADTLVQIVYNSTWND
jgi:hypothetical protein